LKTLRLIVCIFFALLCVLPAVAQDSQAAAAKTGEKWSSFYYINVPIEKVYPHRLGYVVAYRKSGNELARAYLPVGWFTESAGKGELIKMGSGTDWPYLTVYFKEGKFSHVRMHVKRNYDHASWGNLSQGTSIDERFNVEELKLEF
jgi:hypothetical protein